jgi:hypothetical protein
VTELLEAPVTVAVNCRVAEAVRAAAEGFNETATDGVSVTVAVAKFVGSRVLVAVTKTLCRLAIVAGAV